MCLTMASSHISLLVILMVVTIIPATRTQSSCQSCNCQLNNVNVLDNFVTARISQAFNREPGCCLCAQAGRQIFEANLTSGASTIVPGYGLSWITSLRGSGACAMQGVLNISFPAVFNPPQRRLLQFDLYFAKPNTGYNFNIADSTNNGHGGDAGDSSNSAEVHNRDEIWYTYANLKPGYTSYIVSGNHLVEQVNSAISNFITVTIGDEYVEFDNHRGIQKKYKSEFLFALSGQSSTRGQINHDIYFGLNRVVYPFSSVTRTGVGLCRAVIRAYDC